MGKIKRADLDLIRCFAIIFVISVHGLSYVGFYELSNPSITLFVCHLIRVIVIICVPLFLILTGYLSAEKEYILSEYSARDCAPRPHKLSIRSGGIEHPHRRR